MSHGERCSDNLYSVLPVMTEIVEGQQYRRMPPAASEIVIGSCLKEYPAYESQFDVRDGDRWAIWRELSLEIAPKARPQKPLRRFKARRKPKRRT